MAAGWCRAEGRWRVDGVRLVNHPCRTSDTTAALLPLSSRSGLEEDGGTLPGI